MTDPNQSDTAAIIERMDGDYKVPILAEPEGGPIPAPPKRSRRELT